MVVITEFLGPSDGEIECSADFVSTDEALERFIPRNAELVVVGP
jgi:hypothetical protein